MERTPAVADTGFVVALLNRFLNRESLTLSIYYLWLYFSLTHS
jgi:hypothetical protein